MNSSSPLKLSAELGAKIERLAEETGRPVEELLDEALRSVECSSRGWLGRVFGALPVDTPLERRRKLEMSHAERLKALETGRALPEIEQARLEAQRKFSSDRSGAIFMFLLGLALAPLGVCGIGVGATGIVLSQSAPDAQNLQLAIVWTGVATIAVAVEAALITFGFGVLRPFVSPSVESEFSAVPPVASIKRSEVA